MKYFVQLKSDHLEIFNTFDEAFEYALENKGIIYKGSAIVDCTKE